MNDTDYKRIHKFYTEAITENGDTGARSVHWTNEHQQLRRFDILFGIEDLSGSSILDVGCGLGALYEHLKTWNVPIHYTGIDIIPEYIKKAKRNFPEANFIENDVFEVNTSFDYVLASGAMSFKVKDNKNHYFKMIKKMYEIADKGVAFNMLDAHSHIDNETYAAYSPKEVSDFCGTFADRLEVAIGYLPQDFTIYLYKNS